VILSLVQLFFILAESIGNDSGEIPDKPLNVFGYGGSEEKKDFNEKLYEDKITQDIPQDHGFGMFPKSEDSGNNFKGKDF